MLKIIGKLSDSVLLNWTAHQPSNAIFNPYRYKIIFFDDMANFETLKTFSKKPKNYKPLKEQSNITFSITSQCNMACIYCFAKQCDTGQLTLDIEYAKKALRLYVDTCLKNDNSPAVSFYAAGEPTLRMDFIKQIVSYLESLDCHAEYSITTNLCTSKANIEYLIDKGFYFCLSIDGPPEIQLLQRPVLGKPSNINNIFENLKIIVNCPNSNYHVRSTITSHNVNRMHYMTEWFADFGVKNLFFEVVELSGCAIGKYDLLPLPEIFSENFLLALGYAIEKDIFLSNESLQNIIGGTKKHYCGALSGASQLCTIDKKRSLCFEELGTNILEAFDPQKDFIKSLSIPFKNLCTSFILNYSKQLSRCENCNLSPLCGKTCPRKIFQGQKSNNFYLTPYDWQCKVNKLIIPAVVEKVLELQNFTDSKEVNQ